MFYIICSYRGKLSTQDELQESLSEINKRNLYKDTGKIGVYIGLCIGQDIYSRELLNFIKEKEKNPNWIPFIIDTIGLEALTEVINDFLNPSIHFSSSEDKEKKYNFLAYLDKLKTTDELSKNFSKVIKIFHEQLKQKIHIFFFSLDSRENEATIVYGIDFSPCVFAVVSCAAISSQKRTKIYMSNIPFKSDEEFKKEIKKILKAAFLYYIFVIGFEDSL